jgi:putative aldouronate transport system substrate-binding protein
MLFSNTYGIGQPLTWFGGGNAWVEQDGKLVPVELTAEYDETVEWVRKGVSEGVMGIYPEGTGGSAAFEQGLIGFIAAYMDDAPRTQDAMLNAGKETEMYLTNGLAKEKGQDLRFPAIDGFNQLLAISTQKVKDEAELDRVLYFFDRMCEPEMMAIIDWGFEEMTYTLTEDRKYALRLNDADKEERGVELLDFRNGYNQMVPLLQNPNKEYLIGEYGTPLREEVTQVRNKNVQYAIGNPAAGYISATRQEIGGDLDAIINEARVAYISGEIDAATWQREKQRWLDAGEQKVIDEINAIHEEIKGRD